MTSERNQENTGTKSSRWYECWCCGHRIYFQPGIGTRESIKHTVHQHSERCKLGLAIKTLL